MAFDYEEKGKTVFGDKVIIWGVYTNTGGGTGGDITTGLKSIDFAWIQATSAAVVANQHVITNTTWPLAATSFAVVTNSLDSGVYQAQGNY